MKVIVIIPVMFDSYLESNFFKAVVSKYDHTTFVYSGGYSSKYQNSASCRFISNDEFYSNNPNLVQRIGWRNKV